jgi:hypothetical protein
MAESLTLKWGTIKGWGGFTDKSVKILERFFADGVSMSCAMDHPDADRRLILCELIDQLDCETIHLDWDGKDVNKDEAKKYVLQYNHPS